MVAKTIFTKVDDPEFFICIGMDGWNEEHEIYDIYEADLDGVIARDVIPEIITTISDFKNIDQSIVSNKEDYKEYINAWERILLVASNNPEAKITCV
jgi:hypothetical protein